MKRILVKEIDLILDELELIRRRLEIMKSIAESENTPIITGRQYNPAELVVTVYSCPAVSGVEWNTYTGDSLGTIT